MTRKKNSLPGSRKWNLIFWLALVMNLYLASMTGQNLNWIRQTGGIFADNSVGLTVDNVLNIYGVTNFSGNITLTTGQNFSSFGKEDFLVKKFSPSGVLLWARKFGGKESDFAHNITADAENNTYITGTFQDTLKLFDQTLLIGSNPMANNGFIIKLNAIGDILWAKSIQSSNGAYPIKAKANLAGEVFIAGNFEGMADFNPGPGQNLINSTGLTDMFFLKLSASGDLIWARKIGGSESESIFDMQLTTDGSMITTGQFNQVVDFNPGSGEAFTDFYGGADFFVHKLSSDGIFVWVKAMGGVGFDTGLGLDLAPNNDVVIVGRYSNTVDFNPSQNQSFNLISEGSWDGFVLRLNEAGDYVWAVDIGASQNDQCTTVDVSVNDNICVGGIYRGTVNFNPDLFPNQFSSAVGGADIFTLILNANGSYNSHVVVGGLGNEQLNKILIYSINNILSVGNFAGIVDFDPSQLTANLTSTGNTDGFLLNVFNCIKPFIPIISSTHTSICAGQSFTITLPGAKLNGANQWSWYQSSCSTNSFATGISITGTITQNTVFYVRGTGGCTQVTDCEDIAIEVFTDTLTNQLLQICTGDSVVVGTNVYRNTGLYIDTLLATAGCDSVVFTNLSVVVPAYFEQSFSICPGEEVMVGNNIYRNNGIYMDTLQRQQGCDSIITTEVIVFPTEIITQDVDLCAGETFIVEDSVYTDTGVYINSIVSPDGCENFIITNLTVYPLEYFVTHDRCFGDTVRIGNQFYTTSLIVVEFLGSSRGCDSIVNHTINFYDTSFEDNDYFLCAGDSLVVGNQIYTESGLYVDSLLSVAGCDSIIQSNVVFFDRPDPKEFKFKICEGQSVLVNGVTYFSTGIYRDTLQTAFGCDSILIIDLQVFPIFTQNLYTICQGDSIRFGNEFIKKAGIYSKVFLSSLGCDSTSTIIVTVINTIREFQTFSICNGESVQVASSTYTTSGIYLDTLVSSRGCDSIIETTVIVKPENYSQSFQICQGEVIRVGTSVYTQSGIFKDSLVSVQGCDSIITTNVVVKPKDFRIQNLSICAGKSVQVGNSVYTQSGIYTNNFKNQFGCDSTVETRLTVVPAPTITLDTTICPGAFIKVGNLTFSMAGNFDVYVSSPGKCDTLVKIALKVAQFNEQIARTGNNLSVSDIENAVYQWYTCGQTIMPVQGATSHQFSPPENGDYLVEVTIGNCTFRTPCFNFIKTSVHNIAGKQFDVYPNPVQEILTAQATPGTSFSTELIDVLGRTVIPEATHISVQILDVSMMAKGSYYLVIKSGPDKQTIPLVIF